MPTFFSRLLLRARFHVPSEGSGLRGCQISEFSGGAHTALSAAPGWRNVRQEGKHTRLPAPSPRCSGLCPGAKQSVQMGSVSSGHTGPRYWIHHQLVMNGNQSKDLASRRRLGGVQMADGAGMRARGVPFYWNRASRRA